MRRFGDPIDPQRAYRTRPGAYGVILRDGQALLTEQDATEREFQLPGGALDPGEGMVRALHRECLEETGWRIRVLRHLGTFQRYTYMPDYDLWARKVCHIYLCAPGPRIGPPLEAAHRAVWVDAQDALGLLANAGDRHYLARALSNPAA